MELIEILKTRTRHPFRPRSSDIVQHLFEDFRDYKAKGSSLIMGEGHMDGKRVYVIGQLKPKPDQLRNAADLGKLNWGMLTSEEHSQVLAFLRRLEKTGPHEDAVLLSMIDTYGADISMESARQLQAFFIAHLIRAYLCVPIRTVSIVIGEGGSGGALALQVADRRAAMEDALYATAPPESLAAIIFRDANRIEQALAISKSTAKDLKYFNVIDSAIPQPKKVDDTVTMARHIKAYLDKTVKELGKIKLERLMQRRLEQAMVLGVVQRGKFYEIKRFIERPLKKTFTKPPSDIKLISDPSGSTIHLDDTYGDGTALMPGDAYIRCGEEKEGACGDGCGAMIALNDYMDNHLICPHCGKQHVLDAAGWVNVLADQGTFHELFRNITVADVLPEEDLHAYYRDFLAKQKGRSTFTESLVTGHARMHGYPAVLAISEFNFAGGSMGVVFGEKFRMAVEYATRKRWPLVSVCCSGGARLYEGIVALMQMTKTVASVERLKRAGIPFISILADPSSGGAIASYAALGDVCLAEPNALVIFTGPRVMKARGFAVQDEMVRSDSLLDVSAEALENPDFYGEIRGIQEVVPRARMRRAVAKYLQLYERFRAAEKPKKGLRPYIRMFTQRDTMEEDNDNG